MKIETINLGCYEVRAADLWEVVDSNTGEVLHGFEVESHARDFAIAMNDI